MEMALFVQRDLSVTGDARGRVGIGSGDGTIAPTLGVG